MGSRGAAPLSRPLILISAGEASGDRVGGLIAKTLLTKDPNLQLCGIGGQAMQANGVDLWSESTHLGVIGLFEVIAMLPEITRVVRSLRRRVGAQKPDAAILISCEGLNVPLGWLLRRQGIPTMAYLPPQIWMWRRFTRSAGLFFDWVLAAFPEKFEVYRRSGAKVRFVGHYLRDIVVPRNGPPPSTCARNTPHHIAFLPGSRVYEFQNYTPILLDAALEIERLAGRLCSFSLPLASSDYRRPADEMIRSRGLQQRVNIQISAREAMTAAEIGLIASGTASLEATLVGLPFVLFYRLSGPTVTLTRLCQQVGLITDDCLGLPNLVAGHEIVPELYQKEVSPRPLAEAAVDLLRDPHRQSRMRTEFAKVATALGDGHSLDRIAAAALELAAERQASVARHKV